eukprot:5563915-Prorocentrum_lima.AAC.1
MTSSLVGSEMCIRDRTKKWEKDNGPWPEIAAVFVVTTQTIQSNFPDTVSYTHLTLPTICSV